MNWGSDSVVLYILVSSVTSYLLGSLSSAIIIARLLGLKDPRLAGSKNAGATNMNRLFGKKVAIFTLVSDGLKGSIAIFIAMSLGLSEFWQIFCGLVVMLGHIYPVFFSFKGGKGVATFIGVLLVFHYPSFLIFTLTWLLVAKVLKISSVSALCASIVNLACFWVFFNFPLEVKLMMTLITLLLFFTHRSNLANLFRGTEK